MQQLIFQKPPDGEWGNNGIADLAVAFAAFGAVLTLENPKGKQHRVPVTGSTCCLAPTLSLCPIPAS
ncbi:hypothetical protein [Hymenobacter perfusus]|uniref:Uncharacterized protein n=1 Tax=Hymenobacter perfusus TaxID=1236770 RepID=A0A3R9N260_9BACT|nr:hypothetical protein [Hymenobacter perfusus]RSK46372.1 hypothetical protein EI293_04170 [Hymenobacter perfusus]